MIGPRLLGVVLVSGLGLGCAGEWVESPDGMRKRPAALRAARRAYDGAPPVIPHGELGASCAACHDTKGVAVAGLGYASPQPHASTPGLGLAGRCRQCHVGASTEAEFRANDFRGRPQDLRPGSRLYSAAPPVIPHAVFMRETCTACHTGPAAREAFRTTHPDRTHCSQCHVPATAPDLFPGDGAP